MSVWQRLRIGIACALAAACAPLGAREPAPALILDPTPEARDELAREVAALAGASRVTLAPDAFTQSSRLALERVEPESAAGGRPATGRTLGAPVEITLMTDGDRCVLVRGDVRVPLERVRCIAEPPPP